MIAAVALSAGLGPITASAHEGHVHKFMGTVAAIHQRQLEVAGTDGKRTLVTLSDKSEIRREKEPLKSDAIKVGDRVVVTATEVKGTDGKLFLSVKEVRLGTAGTRGTAKK